MAGEGDEKRDRESAVCVFYHCCICSPLSSEGLTKGNNIGKIVFRSTLRHSEHFAFSQE